MDNSQRSNIFSSPNTSTDAVSYEDLVSRTKLSLSKTPIHTECDSTFSSLFTIILEDSGSCISQALELIRNIVSNKEVELSELKGFIQDAVGLLHLLSNYLKSMVESVSMQCSSLKFFPTSTGKIILSVFTHCKESELLYGMYISQVQKELKDLFRTCHELQITYLMILEKHLLFDLTDQDQLDILVEVLEINLRIGEVVQMLDVKTMAEQWKAYTMICEKYKEYLINSNIFDKATCILCGMVDNNLKTAIEIGEDDKVIMRSLKITSFMIKILLRVCSIFKQANVKSYQRLLEMLIQININNCAYLEMIHNKSQHFINTMNAQVGNPTQSLIEELLPDTAFFQCLLEYKVLEISDDNKLLGLTVLMISIMTASIGNNNLAIPKHKVMEGVLEMVSHGHVWFNLGLKFHNPCKDKGFLGLYEYLLSCSVAFSATFNSSEFEVLERTLFTAIIRTDFWTALFASDVLVMLAQFHNRVVNQVVSLCDVYKRLENNHLFWNSPQHIHLTHTIQRLHITLSGENKIIVQRQLTSRNLLSLENTSLWHVLEIKELPNEIKQGIENSVVKRLKSSLQSISNAKIKSSEDVKDLINIIRVAATCTFDETDHTLEDCIVKTWSKACNNGNRNSISQFNNGNLWYLHFLVALVQLTINFRIRNSVKFIQVLHIISTIQHSNKSELKLAVIDLLLNLSQLNYGSNKNTANILIVKSFKKLLKEDDEIVKNKFLNSLRKYNLNSFTETLLSHDLDGSDELEIINKINGITIEHTLLKEALKKTSHNKFVHKCMENDTTADVIELSDGTFDSRRTNSNFDFADIDMLFGAESDTEQPASKKVKLECNEVDDVILRLESDVTNLSSIKENVINSEHKVRLRHICDKLMKLV